MAVLSRTVSIRAVLSRTVSIMAVLSWTVSIRAVLSWTFFPLGLFSPGQSPLGLFSPGQFPLALFSPGQFPLGLFSSGQFSLGLFSQDSFCQDSFLWNNSPRIFLHTTVSLGPPPPPNYGTVMKYFDSYYLCCSGILWFLTQSLQNLFPWPCPAVVVLLLFLVACISPLDNLSKYSLLF